MHPCWRWLVLSAGLWACSGTQGETGQAASADGADRDPAGELMPNGGGVANEVGWDGAVAADPDGVNGRLKLLWIACGRDDFLFQRNQDFTAWLAKTGVEHEHVVTSGGHDWMVWRDYLAEFLPLLFQ